MDTNANRSRPEGRSHSRAGTKASIRLATSLQLAVLLLTMQLHSSEAAVSYQNCSSETGDPKTKSQLISSLVAQEFLEGNTSQIGRFIADFMKLVSANHAMICVYGQEDALLYQRLAFVLLTHQVYADKCQIDTLVTHLRKLKLASPSATRLRTIYRYAIIYLSTSQGLQATLDVLRRDQEATESEVPMLLLGKDLGVCTRHQPRVTSWFQASFQLEGLVTEVILLELFLFDDSPEVVIEPIARWRGGGPGGVSMQVVSLPGWGPSDFKGHKVKVVAFPYDPFIKKASQCRNKKNKEASSARGPECQVETSALNVGSEGKRGAIQTFHVVKGGGLALTGYLVDVIAVAADKLNFKLVLHPIPKEEYKYGVNRGDGNYTGLVGALQRKEAAVGLATFSITEDRLAIMDFSSPVDYTGYTLYIRTNASLTSVRFNTYVQSFHWGTWIAVVVLLGIMAGGLYILVHMPRLLEEDPTYTNFSNITFVLFSCLVQQGSNSLPTTLRAQFVLWVFWVASVTLYAAYTARLTSYLTVSSTSLPFSSLKQATNDPYWEVGTLQGTTLPQQMERANKPEYRKLFEALEKNPDLYVGSYEDGIARVLRSNYAFFSETSTMDYMINEKCDISKVERSYLKGYNHMGFTKNLPFRKRINLELQKAIDGGVLDRLRRKWWGHVVPCDQGSAFTELDFGNILTAFFLLGVGVALSMLALLGEICLKKSDSSSDQNNHKINVPVKKTAMKTTTHGRVLKNNRETVPSTRGGESSSPVLFYGYEDNSVANRVFGNRRFDEQMTEFM